MDVHHCFNGNFLAFHGGPLQQTAPSPIPGRLDIWALVGLVQGQPIRQPTHAAGSRHGRQVSNRLGVNYRKEILSRRHKTSLCSLWNGNAPDKLDESVTAENERDRGGAQQHRLSQRFPGPSS